MSYLQQALLFILDLAFDLAIGLFVVRLLLQWCRGRFNNPLSQSIYRWTFPVLAPLRRLLPSVRRFDLAAFAVAFALAVLSGFAMLMLRGLPWSFAGVLLLGLAILVKLVLTLYLILILAGVVLSWVGGYRHPAGEIIATLTEPVLNPFRRLLPATGGMDFSPLLAGLAIMLARILIEAPLFDAAMAMSQAS